MYSLFLIINLIFLYETVTILEDRKKNTSLDNRTESC